VLIHPSGSSAHLADHADDVPHLVTVTETVQVTAAGTTTCGSLEPPVIAQVAPPRVTVLTSSVMQNTPPTAVAPAQGLPAVAAPAAAAAPAVAGLPAAAAPALPAAQAGVLGAQATIRTPKHNAGGVLGAVSNVAGTSLPFTGFPLWIAALVGVALIAGGLMLRGRGAATRP
jgi:hypothetical protein